MAHTVLIVDDDNDIHSMFGRRFERAQIAVVSARSLDEAEQIINERLNDFSCILVDGCLNGDYPDTRPLIEMIVERGFKGPLIAMSSARDYRDWMVDWGCTHKAPKYEVTSLVMSLLDS